MEHILEHWILFHPPFSEFNDWQFLINEGVPQCIGTLTDEPDEVPSEMGKEPD